MLEPAELDRLREKYLEFTAALAARGLTHHQVNGWWALNRYFFSVCCTPAILDRMESLIGLDMMIWTGSSSPRIRTTDPRCRGIRTPTTGT